MQLAAQQQEYEEYSVSREYSCAWFFLPPNWDTRPLRRTRAQSSLAGSDNARHSM